MDYAAIILSVITFLGIVVKAVFDYRRDQQSTERVRVETRREWPEQMLRRVESLEKREQDLQARLDAAEDENSDMRLRFELLEREHDQLRLELEAERGKSVALEGRLHNIEQENLLLRKQNEALHTELEGLYRQIGRPRPSPRTPLPPPLPGAVIEIDTRKKQ